MTEYHFFSVKDVSITISRSIFHSKSSVDLDFILSAVKYDYVYDATSLGPLVWKQRATIKKNITKGA